jgi:protein TonB
VAGGVPGGVPGGVVGGVPGGVVGGVPGGTLNSALPFGLGMTRPQQIAGAAPQYSREAIAARVEGKVIVRCIITIDGQVRDCKVIKGVPILQDIVLDSLRQSRYTPVSYQGHPEAVQYVFTFNFKLP